MLRILSRIFCIIAIVFCAACVAPFRYYQQGVARTRPVQISIDERFSPAQQVQIYDAFVSWRIASGDRVDFVINWNQKRPGPYEKYKSPKSKNGIFMWYLDKNTEVSETLRNDWIDFLGLMVYGSDERSGNVLIFTATKEQNFYPVVLHEIGHLIGMKHIPGIVSVMKPETSIGCITQLDAQQLCRLYGCIPRPQCSIEEQRAYFANR